MFDNIFSMTNPSPPEEISSSQPESSPSPDTFVTLDMTFDESGCILDGVPVDQERDSFSISHGFCVIA